MALEVQYGSTFFFKVVYSSKQIFSIENILLQTILLGGYLSQNNVFLRGNFLLCSLVLILENATLLRDLSLPTQISPFERTFLFKVSFMIVNN